MYKIKSTTYQLLCLLTLVAHVFNSVEIGGVKLFYLPFVLTFIYSHLIKSEFHIKRSHTSVFICIALVFSSILSFGRTSIISGINIILIIYSLRKLARIDLSVLFKCTPFFSIVVLLLLLFHYFSEITFRYQGFYEDPNYFVLTLILFAYLNICSLNYSKSRIKYAIVFLNLIIILLLTLFSLSRTGLLCVLILYFIYFWTYLKLHPLYTICFCFLIAIFAWDNVEVLLEDQIDNLFSRFDGRNTDDVSSAGNLRLSISKNGLIQYLENPQYWIQGIGPGQSASLDIPGYNPVKSGHRDHNTFTSVLVEDGAIGFLLFCNLLLSIFKTTCPNIKFMLHNRNYLLAFVLLIIVMLFCVSTYNYYYLPFWMLLFILENPQVPMTTLSLQHLGNR